MSKGDDDGIPGEQSTNGQSEPQPEQKAGGDLPGSSPSPAVGENAGEIKGKEEYNIRFIVVTNDGDPTHMIMLAHLKNIFAKQLPKMPQEYIVRLVFDRRHKSMALCRGNRPIGGICYRAFLEQKFAEIAFCAVTATEQVKGFGTQLMNELKQHVIGEGITHFLTYADNYAIGYFKKQGFSKSIGMPKDRWSDYIKDYDGGTLMECYIHPTFPFSKTRKTIEHQRQFIHDYILARITLNNSYPGLDVFKKGLKPGCIFEEIPGLIEHGWNMHNVTTEQRITSDREQSALTKELLVLWGKAASSEHAWPFLEPVDTGIVTDYLEIVQDPIDLRTMRERLDAGDFYKSHAMLLADMLRMCDNCKLYNAEGTSYFQAALELETVVKAAFAGRK